MHPFQTILLPTDFSGPSQTAADLASSLALEGKCRLVVLHVAESTGVPLYGAFGPSSAVSATIPDSLKRQLENYPVQAAQIERRMEEGNPSAIILRVAEEIKPDLIVLGSHGRTGLKRLLMGSVAETVLRKAPCPVLIVKTPVGEAASQSNQESSLSSGDNALRHSLRVPHD